MTLSLRHVHEPSLLRRENDIFSTFERGFDDLFDKAFGAFAVADAASERRAGFNPQIDIKETKKDFKVVAELAGLDKDDIDVSVKDGLLTISGEKKAEKEETEGDYRYVERSFGCFYRSVSLPDTVDAENIKSAYKNGVLTVTLPKNKKAIEEPKKIPITAL